MVGVLARSIDFRCGGLRISGLGFYGMLGELLCPPRGVKRQNVKALGTGAFFMGKVGQISPRWMRFKKRLHIT
jgi:hypothetical protein